MKKVIHSLKQSPFLFLVIAPCLLFAAYQLLIATERFESSAQVIVKQPDGMATMDASMAVLTGLGVPGSATADTEIVKAYIYSNDMLAYLDEQLNLTQHYAQSDIDYFSRLPAEASKEDLFEFYQNHLNVYIDSNSAVLHIQSQGFSSEFAHKLTQAIVERAEWYINSIGHQLAQAQLTFIKGEHTLVEDKLELAQKTLLTFQQKYNLLDPTAEGAAMQQIAYSLEGQISAKEAEIKSVKSTMTNSAPRVLMLEAQLNALKQQLQSERNKLSTESNTTIPVSEILANYTDLKVKMELALQAYTSSQVSLEKARVEAYRQIKYLVVVETPTKPQTHKYPDVVYNIVLFSLIMCMIYAIGRIILLTIKELK